MWHARGIEKWEMLCSVRNIIDGKYDPVDYKATNKYKSCHNQSF